MINDIDLLMQQRQIKKKQKQKNQIPNAIVLCIIALVICAFLWKFNHKYFFYWTIGIGFGFVIRYSRFCFSGVFRDFIFLGNTKLLKGLLLSMMVSTLGFGVIQYNYLKNNSINYVHIPGSITSVGLHIAIGAFIFGIGMTIAGSCSSGVLTRIGEGHALPWIILLGFIVGDSLGAKHYPFWYNKIIKNARVIYFPEYVDLKIVIVLQLLVLMILYKLVCSYENKKNNKL